MWEFTEEIEINAPPEAVWGVVTDVARHPQLAGSGEVRAIRLHGPLAVGSSWDADERIRGAGAFTARSECLELQAPNRFAWRSIPPPLRAGREDSVADVVWWFDLEPTTSGTRLVNGARIVEPAVGARMLKLFYALGRSRAVQRGMRQTVRNIKAAAEHR